MNNMKNAFKQFLLLTIVSGSLSSVCASNVKMTYSDNFMPYADITMNTYWDPQYNESSPADLVKVSQESGVKSFHLAFITDAGSCLPAWGAQGDYSVAKQWAARLTDQLRANHISYAVSLGGASGNDLSMACSETQLIAAYENIINVYQPNGLDFDIENGSANVARMMSALKQVQLVHPELKISFTLPVLPTGLAPEGENVVRQAATASLVFNVNIMAMDYGPSFTNDMGQYAKQAATNLFNFLKSVYPTLSDAQLWNKVEVTPMIGVNDQANEHFTLANVDDLRNFARQNNIGALSMWSVARDNPCADVWASAICSGSNLQSKQYEFSQRFLQK